MPAAATRFPYRTSLFKSPATEKLDTPTFADRVRVVSDRWTGLLRYAVLVVIFLMVYLLILNPVKKQVLAAFDVSRPALAAGGAAPPLAVPGSAVPGGESLPGGAQARSARARWGIPSFSAH